MDKHKTRKIGTDKLITMILTVIAFVFGFIGLYKLEGTFLDTLYATLRLYGLNCDYFGEDLNLCLHIARYLAPLALISFVITALSNFIENIVKAVKVLWLGYYAVSGSGENYDAIVNQFAMQKVKFAEYSSAIPKRAKLQVYIADAEQDLAQIVPPAWDDAGSSVSYYLVANTLLEYSKHPANVTLCSLANLTGRLYWKDNPIKNHNEKIAIIGSGRYAEQLLMSAICNNVIGVSTNIKYYVFGNMNNFIATHYKMDKAINVQRIAKGKAMHDMQGDTVYFVESPWEENSQLIAEVDRVIVCKERDSQCVDVYNSLSELYLASSISIKLIEHGILANSLKNQNAIVFGQRDSLCTRQNIINVAYNVTSKMIHANYLVSSQKDRALSAQADMQACVALYKSTAKGSAERVQLAQELRQKSIELKKVEQECKYYIDYINSGANLAEWTTSQLFIADWLSMSNFLRRSNEVAADHMPIKVALVMGQQCSGQFDAVAYEAKLAECKADPAVYAELCQVEHTRWARFYFMNNWDYSAVRDNSKRLHHLLVPFDQLSPVEVAKDWENYEMVTHLYGKDNFAAK